MFMLRSNFLLLRRPAMARWCCGALVLSGFLSVVCAQEMRLPPEELEQMDRYEVSRLQEADRAFSQREYRQAEAAYEAFVLEFSQSRALAYAVLRKGRSLHLDNKRFDAIRSYQDVIDYFPNQVLYAAAALYHTGQAHMENGHPDKAVRAWTRMANDPEYQRHSLAARALNELADHLVRNDEADKAMPFYFQVIENFRRENWQAARDAWRAIQHHAIRRQPNETLLREAYQASEGFQTRPTTVPENLERDRDYWEEVISGVNARGRFDRSESKEEAAYFSYWAKQLEGRFSDWDDAQIAWAHFGHRADGNDRRWIERLDEIFAAGDPTPDRILRWMDLLQEHPENLETYHALLDLPKLSTDEHFEALRILAESKVDDPLVVTAFQQSGSAPFSDSQLMAMIERFRVRGLTLAMEYAADRMEDSDRGRLEILRYHLAERQTEAGLELADRLLESQAHGNSALWLKGQILEQAGRYEDAIAAYRQSGDMVSRFWRIAHCYEAMNQIESAVRTLREAEQVLDQQSSEAVWRIAQVYRRSGQETRQQQVLQQLLNHYPESNRSRDAHLALERMGITQLGGGVDAN